MTNHFINQKSSSCETDAEDSLQPQTNWNKYYLSMMNFTYAAIIVVVE